MTVNKSKVDPRTENPGFVDYSPVISPKTNEMNFSKDSSAKNKVSSS